MRKVDAGTPVHLVVATDGSKSPVGDPAAVTALRTSELRAACAVLGLPEADVTRLPLRRRRAGRAGGRARRRHRRGGRAHAQPGGGAGHR